MEKKAKGTRKGYTTGACSAAAARAAVLGLINGVVPEEVECDLPNGQKVKFAIAETGFDGTIAYAVVIKDAGDDHDVTDKAALTAHVHLLPTQQGKIVLNGGKGVGKITMQGL